MNSRFKIYPYKKGSKSAKALAIALGCKQIKHTGNGLAVRCKLINWGASQFTRVLGFNNINQIINRPAAVANAGNKLISFQELTKDETINLPPWTTDIEVAKTYGVVVCRTILNGHSGRGIVLSESPEGLVRALLYTGYIKKKSEFRVHVVRDEVIDIQQKRKRSDFGGEPDTRIRNHQNGWVYCRENLEIPDDLKEQAIKSVRALGLDFGAVDLIYNSHYNKSYTLEVNTAPGLEGTTIEKYKEAFLKCLQ